MGADRRDSALVQQNNTLGAEIEIAGAATLVRLKPDGSVMTDQRELIECGAYGAVERIRWPGMHYRRDIGHRALGEKETHGDT